MKYTYLMITHVYVLYTVLYTLSTFTMKCTYVMILQTQTGVDTTGLELRPSEDLDNSNKMVVVENTTETYLGC